MFAKLYTSLIAGAGWRYKRLILDMLEPRDGPIQLLDCGCHDGAWTSRLAPGAGAGARRTLGELRPGVSRA